MSLPIEVKEVIKILTEELDAQKVQLLIALTNTYSLTPPLSLIIDERGSEREREG